MEGWISIHRQIQISKFWRTGVFSPGQAWIDLLLLANHKPGFIFFRGARVDIKRGQIGWSIESLAKKWRWSRGKVRRFISVLKVEQMIVQKATLPFSLLEVVNYDEYQQNDTEDLPEDGQKTDTNNNENKKKKKYKKEKMHQLVWQRASKFQDATGRWPESELVAKWEDKRLRGEPLF